MKTEEEIKNEIRINKQNIEQARNIISYNENIIKESIRCISILEWCLDNCEIKKNRTIPSVQKSERSQLNEGV
jgi:hypothetical protein